MSHTPTPWKLLPQDEMPYEDLRIQGEFHTICRVGLDDAPVHDYNAEQRANAAFIVRAANCHNELLAVCKSLLTIAKPFAFSDVLETAREVIAKAEDRP